MLAAYVDGVNRGLATLSAVPFEVTLLRQTPAPWQPEDSMLVVLSMFLILQDEDGDYESTLATMEKVLPPEMFELLAPAGTEWDAPVVGAPFERLRSRAGKSTTCDGGERESRRSSCARIGPYADRTSSHRGMTGGLTSR